MPVPQDYVGGEIYFGEASKSPEDTLESLIHFVVDHREFERLKKLDGRSLKLGHVLTSPAIKGYRSAIVNFLVGGCIQRINRIKDGEKTKKLRYSSLLHSEAGRDAHFWQETLTHEIIKQLRQNAEKHHEAFIALVKESYSDLERSLMLAGEAVPELDKVIGAVSQALLGDQINIVKVNSDDDVASLLDDTGQLMLRNLFNIFLGGQVLDRGVTLANLIGFYYGRRPNKYQQDTVLQHSRMYGFRRSDLAVTRFYTSNAIRAAMYQMEEFDASLRAAILSGDDHAVQFIRKAADGTIVPCSPNKILVATTQTLRPFRRILPIGFQSGYKTGANGIGNTVKALDTEIESLCGFNASTPKLVPVATAIALLDKIKTTLEFPDEEAPEFDWDAANAALAHLSNQHHTPSERGHVLLWAAKGRESSREASGGSHAKYIETPDSEKTEGQQAAQYAIHHPILFLLRQNGAEEKGWRDTPFYWPVIRAQKNTPTAIYTAETSFNSSDFHHPGDDRQCFSPNQAVQET